jgi:hypothetical protein
MWVSCCCTHRFYCMWLYGDIKLQLEQELCLWWVICAWCGIKSPLTKHFPFSRTINHQCLFLIASTFSKSVLLRRPSRFFFTVFVLSRLSSAVLNLHCIEANVTRHFVLNQHSLSSLVIQMHLTVWQDCLPTCRFQFILHRYQSCHWCICYCILYSGRCIDKLTKKNVEGM